jgi:carboxyl-terminal processing protease
MQNFSSKRLTDQVTIMLSPQFRVLYPGLFTVLIYLFWLGNVSFTQEPAQPNTPNAIIHSVVDAIEKHYLKARANPLWNIARDALLAGKFKDSSQAFEAIQKQLPYMEDSELNLLTPTQITAVLSEATGEKVGLGLGDFCIDMEITTGRARIVTPLVGSPAMKAGIEPADVIVSINGKATGEMSHEQVMDALRESAPDGTKLQIERGEKTLREVLQPSQEELETLQFAVKRVSGKNIGYIRIALFPPNLGQLARQAVTELEKNKVDGYVLDLRNNPGGFLKSAKDVAAMFVTGTLGYEVRSNDQKEAIEVRSTPLTQKPLAVLINGGTASASEFLAGALQGLQRGTLVGVRSYGRGQAQIFMELAEGYGIQIPSVQFLTPNGQGFKGKGIAPDVEVKEIELPDSQLAGPRDHQFMAAVARLTSDKH